MEDQLRDKVDRLVTDAERQSNRVFKSHDDIVAPCCQAWNKLIEQPWKIMEIGMRDWAHEF